MKTRYTVQCGLLASLMCVLSIVAIPLPSGIPMTLQTFGAALCGCVAEKKRGSIAVAVYLFLGALGLPVFAGGRGGVAALFSLSGGFLFGFLFLSFFCGLGTQTQKHYWIGVGLFLCHFMGVVQFSVVGNTRWTAAFVAVSLPYIMKDILLVYGAWYVAKIMRKIQS